jgi:hypothetical protein
LRRYNKGIYERVVHEHVPAHRISQDERKNLLRALVIGATRRSDDELLSIIPYFLNSRGRDPESRLMPIKDDYPEAGVLRFYYGTNVQAWCDHVISPRHFRR